MRVFIVVALVLGWAVPVKAGNETGVLVTGDGPLFLVKAHVSEWLERHGQKVASTPLPASVVGEFADCADLIKVSCMRDLVDRYSKSNIVVFVRVTPKRATENVTLTAYLFNKGHGEVTAGDMNSGTSNAALGAVVDRLMTKLVGADLAVSGHLKLSSSPSGAQVFVDGEAVGVSPVDANVAPGQHSVGMEREGYTYKELTVHVRAGATETVAIALNASRRDGEARHSSSRAPIIVAAAGAALVIAGTGFIVADKDGAHSTAIGTGLAGVGGVLAIVGTYFSLRRPESRSLPVAAITRDAAYVGWQTRF